MSHPVYFVGAGPGDPELITVKGKRLIQEADRIIYAGSLVPEALLAERRPICSSRRATPGGSSWCACTPGTRACTVPFRSR